MRKIALGLCLVVVAGCGLLGGGGGDGGGGGGGSSQPDPVVYAETTVSWDIAALKEGEWVETETKSGAYSAKTKNACVAIKDGLTWVEQSDSSKSGWVMLLGVDKGDRKTKKAYWGKTGEEAKEIKVQNMPTGGAPAGETPKSRGTVKISKDTVTVSGTAIECDKSESDITTTIQGKDYRGQSTSWMSDKVPFRSWYDEKSGDYYKNNPDIKVEGKWTLKGAAMVKMTSEGSTVQLVGMGTDAKMTVKLPVAK
ncbi:MAG: hypothetical protein FD180_1233 [Planctomycetota bacterium]|nr:MAG: hypothetical protein FD180_1233 [Planctomycetota bacterium]